MVDTPIPERYEIGGLKKLVSGVIFGVEYMILLQDAIFDLHAAKVLPPSSPEGICGYFSKFFLRPNRMKASSSKVQRIFEEGRRWLVSI